MNTSESYLILATILFGFFTLYLYRDEIEVIEEEICLEREKEKKEEAKREQKFDIRHPFLAKLNLDYKISENWKKGDLFALIFRLSITPFIWIARLPYISAKWMYKEGVGYSTGVILVILLYFLIQFSMFQYPGNYPDEYHHIITGKNLVETGEFPILNANFDGEGYVRGAPISYLVALFFSIFGTSLFVAKCVPISLGFINLLLLFKISKYIISNKKIRILLLFAFIFNPWLIFNHFYIRHYVFLEFMFLFLAFLMFKLYDSISYQQKSNGLFYLIIIVLINIFHCILMHDVTKYIIPIATAFGFIYIFLFESQKNRVKQNRLQKIFNLIHGKKFLFLLVFFTGVLFVSNFANIISLIRALLFGATNTSSGHFNFNSFFFGIYLFFTLFFITGMMENIIFKNKNSIVYFLVVPLLVLHYVSSESNQIMRFMVYLLPIFFLLTFYGLEKIMDIFHQKKTVTTILLLFFLIITVNIFQDDGDRIFLEGYPKIPGEIGYYEYEPMCNYVKNNFSEYVIITTEFNNQFENFYGLEAHYELDFKNVFDQHYTHYYDEDSQIYRQFYTNTPVLKNRDEFNSLLTSNKKVCIILSNQAPYFLETSDIAKIKKYFEKEASFVGYDIYIKE